MGSLTHHKWVLVSCLASYFLSIALIYQMSPFFQHYASKCCGATPNIVGVIFAMLPFCSFVGSLVMADFLGRLGARTSLNVGLLALAAATVGFGLSGSVSSFMFWRACQGVSSAVVYTSISTALAQTFTGPGEFAFVNSLQEVSGNLGFSIAPVIGAMLYQWDGFFAPFGVSALGHVLLVAMSFYNSPRAAVAKQLPLLQDQDDKSPPDHVVTWREILTKDQVCLSGAALVALGGWGCVEPTLALHFEASLGISTGTQMGLLFGIPGLFSVVASAVTPLLMERVGGVTVSIAGLLMFALGCATLGLTDPSVGFLVAQPSGPPAPLGIPVGRPVMWVATYGAMILVNFGYGLAWTPILPLMMDLAAVQIAGGKHNSANAVSAFFNAAACMGEACGPIIGGGMSSLHGFAGTALSPAVISVLYVGVLLVRAPHLGGLHQAPSTACAHTSLEHFMSTPNQSHQRSAISGQRPRVFSTLSEPSDRNDSFGMVRSISDPVKDRPKPEVQGLAYWTRALYKAPVRCMHASHERV